MFPFSPLSDQSATKKMTDRENFENVTLKVWSRSLQMFIIHCHSVANKSSGGLIIICHLSHVYNDTDQTFLSLQLTFLINLLVLLCLFPSHLELSHGI